MNLFNAQARILHVRPPKETGKSALLIVAVGVQRNTKESLIQMVNKSVIRVPGAILKKIGMENLVVNEIYEIFGHVNALEKRNMISGESHLTTELLASGVERLSVNGVMDKVHTERALFNRWAATGQLVDYIKGKKPERPDTLILKVRRRVKDKDTYIQGSDRVAVSVGTRIKERMTEVEIGSSIFIECRTAGILRRVPAEIPGEYEQTLHNGLSLSRIQRLGVKHEWADEEELDLDDETAGFDQGDFQPDTAALDDAHNDGDVVAEAED